MVIVDGKTVRRRAGERSIQCNFDVGVCLMCVVPSFVSKVIVVVDDEPEQGLLVGEFLGQWGYVPNVVTTAEAALFVVEREPVVAVLADVHLRGGMSGLALCARVREIAPEVPVIVLTGAVNLDTAIAAMRAGAYDFVVKPVEPENLRVAVARAVERTELRAEVRRLRLEVESNKPIYGMLGNSAPLRDAVSLVRRVAAGDTTVMVTGESGTGKELICRAIHDQSPRSDKPFIAINCAAMPPSLLESELFGHVKGAFTDAKRTRPGLFVQAEGGTLFLDEIGEMPLEMQAKLLRVLQERKVRPVGGDEEIAVDCRLVCATNRDLEVEVEHGRFREDLFYRVNVVGIHVPPLRARGGDVLELAQHFLNRVAKRTASPVLSISIEAARRLLDYDWPGNVRELENCIERAVALSRGTELVVDDLPNKVRNFESSRMVGDGDDYAALTTLAEMEHRYVRKVLVAVGGNKSQAARVLGIDRRSLYRRLEPGADGVGLTDVRIAPHA